MIPATLQGSPPRKEGRFYRPELDALRFFAFLAIFFHHAAPNAVATYTQVGVSPDVARWLVGMQKGGAFGVDLFFALSAYLITTLLLREEQQLGTIHLRHFYFRRALRIWPLYYAFLTIAIVVLPHVLPQQRFPPLHVIGFLLFAGNWTTAHIGYPDSSAALLWTVSVEEQFYLIWPFLLLIMGTHRIRLLGFVALFVATLSRAFLVYHATPHPGIWVNTFARLDPFAVGALLAVAWQHGPPRVPPFMRIGLALIGVILNVAIGQSTTFAGAEALWNYPLATLSSALLLTAALGGGTQVWEPVKGRALVALGQISFGLYVFHALALRIAGPTTPAGADLRWYIGRFALGLLVTLLLAVISYRWLERPFLTLKERFTHILSRPVMVGPM